MKTGLGSCTLDLASRNSYVGHMIPAQIRKHKKHESKLTGMRTSVSTCVDLDLGIPTGTLLPVEASQVPTHKSSQSNVRSITCIVCVSCRYVVPFTSTFSWDCGPAWLSFAPSRNGLFVVSRSSRWGLTVGIRPFDHLHVTRLLKTTNRGPRGLPRVGQV